MGNEGIQISGGSIQAGAIAVGHKAHAEGSLGGADLRSEVETLRAVVERNAAELQDASAALSDVRRILAELEEPQPEAERVTSLLGRLRSGAGHVAEIATSLATVERLVSAVLC